jgi:2-keto-4-pentenoate hydratase/2-oxohepta-3-ene-1,7-dioic acid hydratase in catechol pathway
VDYEAELGVVIGKTAKNVTVDKALGHVLGYCNCNDLSERALQFVSGQWLVGKSLDGFLPIGPYLVTADDIPDPQNLRVRGWLNGELRQDSTTADMIFSVAECIAYISQYITLNPGDIISTGTPEGVILGRPPEKQIWMRPGDEYTVEVSGLGRLSNRMVDAQ